MTARDIVTEILCREHRALAAVLHTLEILLGKVRSGHADPDFALFATAMLYLDDFQERYHHPKEDKFLFKIIRARTCDYDAVVGRLKAGHVSSAKQVGQLYRLLVRYQGGASAALADLLAHVAAYATSMRCRARNSRVRCS